MYTFLKTNFNFIPNLITFDFCLSNIKAINEIYDKDEITIIPCFFHFVQCLWRKASNLGLRKKKNVHRTRILMFNLKLLPFLEENKAKQFYKLIKDDFTEEKYEAYFEYFERTWLSIDEEKTKVKIGYKIWSYYG